MDRHYYMTFRSEWTGETLRRTLWIHLPSSHLAEKWPNVDGFEGLQRLNADLADSGFAFDFSKAKFVHRVVRELNEHQFTHESFQQSFQNAMRDYNQHLEKYFGPKGALPDDYPRKLYDFERTHFFDELPQNKQWVFFPVCFRGVWVSILAARVPSNESATMASLLPLLSSTIAEKILTVHASKTWAQPFGQIRSYADAIALVSLAAAQCGLKIWEFKNGKHIFSDGESQTESPVGPFDFGSKKVAVTFVHNDSLGYFDKIWPQLEPFLRAFSERSRASLRFAQAAIMSRNFSHNVGSHSLANPLLHESVGLSRIALIARNENHGKHISGDIGQRLSIFHSYAQGRLDFLARAISKSGNRPEPLFFLNDVLDGGFFKQGVLLDTLIEDAGFAAKDIEFHVQIQKADQSFGGATYTWGGDPTIGNVEQSQHRFVRSTLASGSGIDDVVVGIPGGMIGTHALYAFLENAMRNAVKYGGELQGHSAKKTRPYKLQVHLRLEQCMGLREGKPESGWVLSIWDNVSSDPDSLIAKGIRKHINESLIDERDGEMQPKGHGIQEMKLCAELLSGGENGLRFPADHGYHATELDRCAHCEKSCTASQEYTKHGMAAGNHEAITDPQPLRCYSSPHVFDTSKQWLTYNLFIPIPVLLGVVSPQHVTSAQPPVLPPHIRYFQNVRELATAGAHIGVLLDDGKLGTHDVADEIGRLHPCLPFRLMVVTEKDPDKSLSPIPSYNDKARNPWKAALYARQKPADQPFKYPDHIPVRRVRVCGGQLGGDLKKLLSNPSDTTSNEYLGAGGRGPERWDAIVLRAYDAWMREFKPVPATSNETWKLCIGFEHGGEKIGTRWGDLLHRFGVETSDRPCVGVLLVSKRNKEDTNPIRAASANLIPPPDNAALAAFNQTHINLLNGLFEQETKDETPFNNKQLLLFDNHGAVFENIFKGYGHGFQQGLRFYQSIGLKDGLSLYQSLESPPASAFGFALFLFSLAEGALTRIAILDERVAQATLDSGQLFRDTLHRYQTASVFPLFRFRNANGSNNTPVFVSNRLQAAKDLTEHSWTESMADPATWNALLAEDTGEGLHLAASPTTVIVVKMATKKATFNLADADVLVFHEGVADRLGSEKAWKRDDTAGLFAGFPFLVRTSGRGQESRHLRNVLPFVEFTEVSENTYQDMNKVGLVKSLIGATGNPRILEKEFPPL